eukprot:6284843-Amphidinium_carterae.1
MRETELANLLRKHIKVEPTSVTVPFGLSKVDQEAKGAGRKLDCMCTALGEHLCPGHILREMEIHTWKRSVPLTVQQVCVQEGSGWHDRATARKPKLGTKQSNSAPKWGGHSLRRGGTLFAASRV